VVRTGFQLTGFFKRSKKESKDARENAENCAYGAKGNPSSLPLWIECVIDRLALPKRLM
jgi:hypothetical protein